MAARNTARGACLAGALFWAGTRAWAGHPIKYPAPEFPLDKAWINAKPFTLSQLRYRRVLVVAFLNTANANSLRALKVLSRWFDRYALEGLLVIGVHTPDYAFQKDPAVVKGTIKRLGVEFPVVLDNDRQLWKAYANEGWPAFYLIDHKGRVIYDALGEGGYAAFEEEIRDAIEAAGYPLPSGPLAAEDPPAKECGAATPDRSLGTRGPKSISLDEAEVPESLLLVTSREGEVSHRGQWTKDLDALRLAQKNPDHSASLRILYRGAQALAVLGPGRGETRFFVRQNNLWLHSGNAGRDVRLDEDGRSFVAADSPRLYHLTQNPNDAMQELTLIPTKPDATIHAFSFSEQCLQLR